MTTSLNSSGDIELIHKQHTLLDMFKSKAWEVDYATTESEPPKFYAESIKQFCLKEIDEFVIIDSFSKKPLYNGNLIYSLAWWITGKFPLEFSRPITGIETGYFCDTMPSFRAIIFERTFHVFIVPQSSFDELLADDLRYIIRGQP